MLFEEMPEEFVFADVESALLLAAEVEEHEPSDLRALGTVLVARGDAERATRDAVGVLVVVDGLVCQLHLHDVAHEHWGGIPLGPMIEMDGSAFPPYVRSFPSSVFGYLEGRSKATQRNDARAGTATSSGAIAEASPMRRLRSRRTAGQGSGRTPTTRWST